jgi:organic hydroperoxide reductase OsmC/OhrA
MARDHRYIVDVEWIGNRGPGTSTYESYDRDHVTTAPGKTAIEGSSDPAFRGDRTRWNPEELLVASLSQCHMLWYLHLAAAADIRVLQYRDAAEGVMTESSDGGGHFVAARLKPSVVLAEGADLALATALHMRAHEKCFIARSVNFPVTCEPVCVIAPWPNPRAG